MPFFRSAVLGAIISHRQHSADGFTLVVWGGLFKPRSRMILSLEMARPTSVITAHKWWPRICSTIPCNNGSAEIQISSKHGVLPVKKNNDGSKCWAEIIKKKNQYLKYTRVARPSFSTCTRQATLRPFRSWNYSLPYP